jgi:hypothetical protein
MLYEVLCVEGKGTGLVKAGELDSSKLYEVAPFEDAQVRVKVPVVEEGGTVMLAGAGGGLGRVTVTPFAPAVHALLPDALDAQTR